MALVHDMAEAIAGDITPHCGVSETDKQSLEKVWQVFIFSSKKILCINSSSYIP